MAIQSGTNTVATTSIESFSTSPTPPGEAGGHVQGFRRRTEVAAAGDELELVDADRRSILLATDDMAYVDQAWRCWAATWRCGAGDRANRGGVPAPGMKRRRGRRPCRGRPVLQPWRPPKQIAG